MLKTIENETFYSPEDLAKRLKLSLSSIYKLIRNGELPHIQLGKVYRIPASDFQKYLLSRSKKVTFNAEPKVPETAKKFVELLRHSPEAKNILEVWLFGSYARGDYDTDSDVDLAIILANKTLESSKAIATLVEEAMEIFHYEDLLSLHEIGEGEWLSFKKNQYLLAQTIEKEGILLWNNH